MRPRVTASVMSAGTLAAWLAAAGPAWRIIAEAALPCLALLLLLAWTISDADRTQRLCALIRAFRNRDQQASTRARAGPSGSRAIGTAKRLGNSSHLSAAPHAGPAAQHSPRA